MERAEVVLQKEMMENERLKVEIIGSVSGDAATAGSGSSGATECAWIDWTTKLLLLTLYQP